MCIHTHSFVDRLIMLKKDTERAKITKTDDQGTPGRVKQSKSIGKISIIMLIFLLIVCQDFLVHSDSGFAYRLQKEECRSTCFSFDQLIMFFFI